MKVTSKPANETPGTLTTTEVLYLRRHEQRLERRKETASSSVRTAWMALAAHRARDRCAPGDRKCIPEGRWHWCATARGLGAATAGKTGQRSDHRVDGGIVRYPQRPQPQPRKPFF